MAKPTSDWQRHITRHKPHTAAAVALLCHRQSGLTAYRPQTKPAPTDFDLQPSSYTQPWPAVFMVSIPVIHVVIYYMDYYLFTTLEGWKAEFARLADPLRSLHLQSGHMSIVDQA